MSKFTMRDLEACVSPALPDETEESEDSLEADSVLDDELAEVADVVEEAEA